MKSNFEIAQDNPTNESTSSTFNQPEFIKKVKIILITMASQLKNINILKIKNFELIKESKTAEETAYLFYLREIYEDLIEKLEEGLKSAASLLQFVEMINLSEVQLDNLNKDAMKMRDSLSGDSIAFFRNHQKYSRLGVMYVSCEEQIERTIFSLLIEEFYFNKEKYENGLWNMAIGNNSETFFVLLPRDLRDVKWLCNQPEDDIALFRDYLEDYCQQNKDDKKLLINLLFIAHKFFECFNYKCSNYILNLSLEILKEKRTDSKSKYYILNLCNGLLALKFHDYEKGLEMLMSGMVYLKTKFGIDTDKDLLIAIEFMNVGGVLVNNEFYDLGACTLEISSQCFEQYLPYTYDLWIETVDLLGRCYNDSFDFTIALMTLAPAFDFFHILNFGSIKKDNKPVYELAIEMGDRGLIQKLSKQLKYPGYLPLSMSTLLCEMMLSFSGLGDQTCVLVIKNWIDRCEIMSRSQKRYIIESYDYDNVMDMERVVRKMTKNKKRHEPLFKHVVMNEMSESAESL